MSDDPVVRKIVNDCRAEIEQQDEKRAQEEERQSGLKRLTIDQTWETLKRAAKEDDAKGVLAAAAGCYKGPADRQMIAQLIGFFVSEVSEEHIYDKNPARSFEYVVKMILRSENNKFSDDAIDKEYFVAWVMHDIKKHPKYTHLIPFVGPFCPVEKVEEKAGAS